MLPRLILTLLLAAFTLPGMAAACHDGAPAVNAVHQRMHHMPPGDQDKASVHACIGCIPPSTWQSIAIAAERLPRPIPRTIPIQAYLASRATPPALPPPRLG